MSDVYVMRTRSDYLIGIFSTLADALAVHADPGDTLERWTLGATDSGQRVARFQSWGEWTDDNFERVFDAMGLPDMPDFPAIRT